jgi:hypothetical protein
MIELQQKTLEQKGRVMILTDANAWIGQQPSIVTKPENGYERETLTFERKSEKKEVNKQGETFLSAMNSVDMIILNGIRSEAKCTYDHPGREASSIIDYIAVSENMYQDVSDLSYRDCRDTLQTDHILLTVQVMHEKTTQTKKKVKKKKK